MNSNSNINRWKTLEADLALLANLARCILNKTDADTATSDEKCKEDPTFRNIDTNNDNKITKSELNNVAGISNTEAKEIVETQDRNTDNNNSIDANEFDADAAKEIRDAALQKQSEEWATKQMEETAKKLEAETVEEPVVEEPVVNTTELTDEEKKSIDEIMNNYVEDIPWLSDDIKDTLQVGSVGEKTTARRALQGLVEEDVKNDTSDDPIETKVDRAIAKRREMTPEEVVDEYEAKTEDSKNSKDSKDSKDSIGSFFSNTALPSSPSASDSAAITSNEPNKDSDSGSSSSSSGKINTVPTNSASAVSTPSLEADNNRSDVSFDKRNVEAASVDSVDSVDSRDKPITSQHSVSTPGANIAHPSNTPMGKFLKPRGNIKVKYGHEPSGSTGHGYDTNETHIPEAAENNNSNIKQMIMNADPEIFLPIVVTASGNDLYVNGKLFEDLSNEEMEAIISKLETIGA